MLLGGELLFSGVGDALPLPERRLGHPVGGLAGRLDLGVHLVDLLERHALGLVDVEVHKGDADEAAAEPDEEDPAWWLELAGGGYDEGECAHLDCRLA